MNKQISIELPFPPSANRYWRNVNGRMVKSAAARTYRDEVGFFYLAQRVGKHSEPFKGELIVNLDFYRPAKRGDLDNRIKIVLDSLEGIVFENDSQIVEIHARRFEDRKRPRVEVKIELQNGSITEALLG